MLILKRVEQLLKDAYHPLRPNGGEALDGNREMRVDRTTSCKEEI